MKYFKLLSILTIQYLSIFNAFSQNIDSLYFPKKSEYQGFIKYIDSKESLLGLSIEIDTKQLNNKTQLKEFIIHTEELKNKTQNMSEKNKLKFIFDDIHNNYLKQYKNIATINDIFSTGTFNCVSASILYASIFNKLKIPYALKETPTHVYIIAYPNTLNIIVESTDVKGLIVEFDENQKKQIINDLLEKKLISQDSLNILGFEKTFEKFMLSDKNIDSTQAIGDMYYNDYITKTEMGNKISALESMYKSYFLNKSDKNKYILLNAYEQLFQSSTFTNEIDFLYLVDYVNLANNAQSNQNLIYYYSTFLIKNIQQKSNHQSCINLYEKISSRLTNEEVKLNLNQFHTIELTKYYLRKNKLINALNITVAGLNANLENNELEYYVKEIITNFVKIQETEGSETTFFSSIDSLLVTLNNIKKTYPNVVNISSINKTFNEFQCEFQSVKLFKIIKFDSKNESNQLIHNKLLELDISWNENCKIFKNETPRESRISFYEDIVNHFIKQKNNYYTGIWVGRGLKKFPKNIFLGSVRKNLNKSPKTK